MQSNSAEAENKARRAWRRAERANPRAKLRTKGCRLTPYAPMKEVAANTRVGKAVTTMTKGRFPCRKHVLTFHPQEHVSSYSVRGRHALIERRRLERSVLREGVLREGVLREGVLRVMNGKGKPV